LGNSQLLCGLLAVLMFALADELEEQPGQVGTGVGGLPSRRDVLPVAGDIVDGSLTMRVIGWANSSSRPAATRVRSAMLSSVSARWVQLSRRCWLIGKLRCERGR
jgi:hypothetical protein